ncbi:MAG TPA: TMEM165/GDT1 family protein [Candidatus Hypogeohydataceae bacterium YC41]
MDWKILFSTFLTIFLAELGDKTQLGVIFLSSQTQKPVSVFIGAVVALAVVTFFGVALGALITKAVPINVIKDIAGGAFILLGILILLGRF